MSGPGAPAFSLPVGAISGPINTGSGQSGAVLVVTDKQQPSADDIAKNFDQTREELLDKQRQQMFSVFLGTLSKKYQDGGGVRLTKPVAPPVGS
jgi:peptidyl-prolyl cis-trans isomerase D